MSTNTSKIIKLQQMAVALLLVLLAISWMQTDEPVAVVAPPSIMRGMGESAGH